MKEVKDPRKDWVKYYMIVLLVMLVFNAVIYPRIQEASVKEVSYNVFMDLTEQQKIDKVQVDPNQILFTEKDSKTVYKTGIMDDPHGTAVQSGRRLPHGHPAREFPAGDLPVQLGDPHPDVCGPGSVHVPEAVG